MTGYTLNRSRRRTVAIHVRGGLVEVRAPLRMPKREIDEFVASKERWIRKRLAQSREEPARRKALDYGDTIAFRGREFPIKAGDRGNRAWFDGEAFHLPPGLTPEQLKAAVPQIYRGLAKPLLTERAAHFAEKMRVAPATIRINGAKTRWGSCSLKKSLNFSWRLVQAPDDLIDYVVVHELAHLIEMNHSVRFWALVAGVLPDFQERRGRLRTLQERLSAEK